MSLMVESLGKAEEREREREWKIETEERSFRIVKITVVVKRRKLMPSKPIKPNFREIPNFQFSTLSLFPLTLPRSTHAQPSSYLPRID